jgi:putative tryptophan/tyrosine transport system substrate-binding protein
MKKRITAFTHCAILFALCFSAEAQSTGKVYRIGYLDPSTASATTSLLEAFRQEMSKRGWIEGKNITIEYRFAELKSERQEALAEELVRWKADVIVAAGGGPSAARKATTTIPIVVASGVDLVAAGLAESLARPGGNVTGLSILGPELITKRLEILKEVVPKLTRVGVLMRVGAGAGTGQQQQMEEIRAAALALKLGLQELPTELDTDALERTFKKAVLQKVNAIIPTAGRQTFAARKPIGELAIRYRLPAIYQEREFVDEGGLMSYGPDFSALYRRAAYFVDRILKGAKPGDLPVEQPTKFEFVVNLKTAKQIGLTIPPNVLARADKVIR